MYYVRDMFGQLLDIFLTNRSDSFVTAFVDSFVDSFRTAFGHVLTAYVVLYVYSLLFGNRLF